MARHSDLKAILGEVGRLEEHLRGLVNSYADGLTDNQMDLPFECPNG